MLPWGVEKLAGIFLLSMCSFSAREHAGQMTVQPCSLRVPVGDGAGMPVSHQGYFGKAQCKSVLGSRGGFEHEDLLPCFCFQVYLFFLVCLLYLLIGLCQAAGLES